MKQLYMLPRLVASALAVLAVIVLARILSLDAGDVLARKLAVDQGLQRSQAELLRDAQVHLFVQPGQEVEAKDYYRRISGELKFEFAGSTLDSLLAYMGYAVQSGTGSATYAGLLANDLESIPSFALMPQDSGEFAALKKLVTNAAAFDALLDLGDFRKDRVLVSRFFAPKIATYYDPADPFKPINPDAIVPGWRKLVRLTARKKSRADRARIMHMYLLFNVKQADPDADPFVKESANNQVILVPSHEDAKDTVYFAVYASRTERYVLSNFLKADFDLPGHVGVEVPGAQDGKYFVPRSCAECHGHSNETGLRGQPVDAGGKPADFMTGTFPYAKPNYLDTDQWYDWAEFDFRGVTTSLNDVVFDGGKAHGDPQYRRAFSVVRTLNKGIRDRTFAAEQKKGTKSFQTLAAEKWLTLHEKDTQRAPYSRRSIGNAQWNMASKDEMRLLRLLDNHCFRCHSSVIYNVFDREAVKKRNDNGLIPFYLTFQLKDVTGKPLPGFRMPQGRVLRTEERDEILNLLEKVFR
jgi:hypothetical protein